MQVNQLICSYQEFNYSIIIEFNKSNIRTLAEIGPFKQIGHDTIHEIITSFFEEGMEYNLILVVLNTIVGTITSHKHHFSKFVSMLFVDGQI